jgi:hypothetical protein
MILKKLPRVFSKDFKKGVYFQNYYEKYPPPPPHPRAGWQVGLALVVKRTSLKQGTYRPGHSPAGQTLTKY